MVDAAVVPCRVELDRACKDTFTYRQKIKHGKTVHVCWEQPMDTFFQEMLGGAGRLQESIGVTLFLEATSKHKEILTDM